MAMVKILYICQDHILPIYMARLAVITQRMVSVTENGAQ